MMRNTRRVLIVAAFILGASANVVAADGECDKECKGNIDWSIGNSTGADQVNCPDQYVATEPKCLAEGGRACLMRRAIDSAKHNNDSYAKRLTLITQCHNGNAAASIGRASEKAVGDYLRTK